MKYACPAWKKKKEDIYCGTECRCVWKTLWENWWLRGLRHCHWLLTVSHQCPGLNATRGMWECCMWLWVRRWFLPGTTVSSTCYNWLVMPQYVRKSDEKWNSKFLVRRAFLILATSKSKPAQGPYASKALPCSRSLSWSMWENYQWLWVMQWLLPYTLVSSTTNIWLVTTSPQYGRESYKYKYKIQKSKISPTELKVHLLNIERTALTQVYTKVL